MDKFLNFRKVDENETELYIYGDIRKKDIIERWLGLEDPERTDAFGLKEALASVDTPNLTVRINSYGGSVSEGLAIYSLLSEFKGHLKTIVDGFACSAASVIFMAGEERVVPENGLLMIHNAWSYAEGDSNVMRKKAEDLEKITQPSVNIYVSKSNLSEEEIKEKMDREEWITSQEAFEWGFSTSQGKKEEMQALEADFVYKLVMKNKELQKQLEDKQEKEISIKLDKTVQIAFERTLKEKLTEICNSSLQGNSKEEPKGLNNLIKEDAWTSFFNTKI